MLDIGWSEIAVIAVVALVVIGPKDLPKALKAAGMFVRKARAMAREFQNSVDDMIREAELDEARKKLAEVTSFDLNREIEKTIDPTGDLKQALEPPVMPDLTSDLAAPATTSASAGTDTVPPASDSEAAAAPEALTAMPLVPVESQPLDQPVPAAITAASDPPPIPDSPIPDRAIPNPPSAVPAAAGPTPSGIPPEKADSQTKAGV